MSSPVPNSWLHRFALATALATLGLIVIGGLVTSHGVGMAVPDWPNSYGYNMFLFPISKWVGGVLYEHSHRLAASFVGLLTAVLALWMWGRETKSTVRWVGLGAILLVLVLMGVRQLPVYIGLAGLAPVAIGLSVYQIRRRPHALRWWGVIAFAAVILQGVLGGLRVVLYKDELGIFHATLAQLFFVLLCTIALLTSQWWQKAGEWSAGRPSTQLGRLLLMTTVLLLAQLIVGATMRHQHAGLAIPDFPLAYGRLWPALDAQAIAVHNQQRSEVVAVNPITAFQIILQMVHRILAALILGAVAVCAWSTRRQTGGRNLASKLAVGWLGIVLLQALLGAGTIWSNKAADIATGHVLVGSLSLAAGAILSIIVFRVLALSGVGEVARKPADRPRVKSFEPRPSAVGGT